MNTLRHFITWKIDSKSENKHAVDKIMTIDSVSNEKYIYLTTIGRKTGKPHTVELWFAVAEGKIYLSHEGAFTDWMKNIFEHGVEFRINGEKFRGKARIVSENTSFEIGKHALYLKYYGEADKNIVDDWFSESKIIIIEII